MEQPTSTDALKEQVQKGQSKLTDVGGILQTTTTFADGSEGWEREEILEKPPTKQRKETIDYGGEIPDDLSEQYPLPEPVIGQIFVADGTIGWKYNPETETAHRYSLENNAAGSFVDTGEIFDLLAAGAAITPVGETTVAGRDGQKFNISYRQSHTPYEESTLILDAKYWYPLKRSETLDLAGESITSEQKFEEIVFNQGISDEPFAYRPPETANVVEETD